jgi:hypothetical protein
MPSPLWPGTVFEEHSKELDAALRLGMSGTLLMAIPVAQDSYLDICPAV